MSLLQEFGPSYDYSASDSPLSVVRDTAPFDRCSAPKISWRYVWSRLRINILAFLQQTEESVKEISSAGPRALVIAVILRRFSNSNFSRSKLNITNLSDRSLEELVFSQKIEKYL